MLCFGLFCLNGPVCGLVSLATLSHETRRATVRRKKRERGRERGKGEEKRKKDTICRAHWISLVMFVKKAGNAYPVRWGVKHGSFFKWKGSSDRRDSWTKELETCILYTCKHASYTYTFASCQLFVYMCLREEVIKEKARLGTAMFTLGFCFPY